MRQMTMMLTAGLAISLCFGGTTGAAEDAKAEATGIVPVKEVKNADPDDKDDPEVKPKDRRKKIMEKFKKLRKAKPRRARNKPVIRFAGGRDWHPKKEEPVIAETELNARDAAHFDIARLLCKTEDYKSAVAELTEVAENSPEDPSVDAANFSIGNICRKHLGDANKAIEHYSKVRGLFHKRAIEAMIETFEELGDIGEAVRYFETLIDGADAIDRKVELLNALAELHRKHDNAADAVEALRRITTLLSYEEAAKLPRRGNRSFAGSGELIENLPRDVAPHVRKMLDAMVRDNQNGPRIIRRKIGDNGVEVIMMENGANIQMQVQHGIGKQPKADKRK